MTDINDDVDYLDDEVEYEGISFKNNPLLRAAGTKIDYTAEQTKEILKCIKDPIYFICNYIKVIHPDHGVVFLELYDFQKRMINSYVENRFSVVKTHRQAGKCCSINTKVKIKQKSTDKIVELTLGELYEWQKFRSYFSEVLQKL